MSNLAGISAFCGGANVAGLQKIEYAPIDNIDEAAYEERISEYGNWQKAVPFQVGTWLELFAVPNDRIWNEEMKRTSGDKYYDQSIDLIVPNLKPEVSIEFERMAYRRFVLKLTDQDGKPWMIGTLGAPLDFFDVGTTGKSGQLKHYRIRFTGQTPRPARGYQPVI